MVLNFTEFMVIEKKKKDTEKEEVVGVNPIEQKDSEKEEVENNSKDKKIKS